MQNLTARKAFWLLLLISVFTIIPFLGLSDFHTKGEPREAIVSYTMLSTGNWILPGNNGGEIAYKPPFFHWCIAAVSFLNNNQVTEATSRMPSAIGLIVMTVIGFLFLGRRKGVSVALLAAFITLTNFELHRAGVNCRVDMVLTALTVIALYSFYRWYEKGLKGIPWIGFTENDVIPSNASPNIFFNVYLDTPAVRSLITSSTVVEGNPNNGIIPLK